MIRIKSILSMLLFTVAIYAMAATLRCSNCKKRISGQYLKSSSGQIFCGSKCYKSILPKCVVCKKRYNKGFVSASGEKYCSKKCLSTTWKVCDLCKEHKPTGIITHNKVFFCATCAKLPKCFSCNEPDHCFKLSDGRNICHKCKKTAIEKEFEAKKLLQSVRNVMRNELKLFTDNKITVRLVDQATLSDIAGHSDNRELGLYRYKCTYTTVTETKKRLFHKEEKSTSIKNKKEFFSVLLLSHIPKKKMIEVISHELAHDWMQAYYPNIKDLKVKEGWAEYVAHLMNSVYGQNFMNSRMENNPDPIYGGGFRKIKAIADRDGNKAVIRYLEYCNK